MTLLAPNRSCATGACAECEIADTCPQADPRLASRELRRVIYIVGRITDPDASKVACHLHLFALAENLLIRAGYAPINPAADWDAVSLGGISYEMCMARDAALIKRCADALWMLDGWQGSKGATREHAWAVEAGIPCVEEDEGLARLEEVLR